MALLSIKKIFDSTITIGDLNLPVHVARLTRTLLAEVDNGWSRVCEPPRGEAVKEWTDEEKEQQYLYAKDVIEKYVTIDAGLIDIDGADVTDGEGLVRVFHSRLDVLGALVQAVRIENRLGPTLAKNSKSPSVSATGSAPSTQRGAEAAGSTPEQIATNVGNSNSAPADAATVGKREASADGSRGSRSNAAGDPVH